MPNQILPFFLKLSAITALTIYLVLFTTSAEAANTATLNLTANKISKDRTGNTYATLQWSSSNTQSCRATGGWTSKTSTSGGQYIYPITRTTTFSMTCTGTDGSVTESVTVSTNGTTNENENSGFVELTWNAPASSQDGSPLDDLAGYKIYYGTSQNSLNSVIDIDAGLTSFVINNLSARTYYFSMSAVDLDGNESSRSNIAAKIVN